MSIKEKHKTSHRGRNIIILVSVFVLLFSLGVWIRSELHQRKSIIGEYNQRMQDLDAEIKVINSQAVAIDEAGKKGDLEGFVIGLEKFVSLSSSYKRHVDDSVAFIDKNEGTLKSAGANTYVQKKRLQDNVAMVNTTLLSFKLRLEARQSKDQAQQAMIISALKLLVGFG